MKTFAIHESNLERLQKKINRIRTKCQKYGCDFYYDAIGEEFRTLDEGEENERVERYVIVECEGTAIVNGWVFAATIDHTEGGNIIRALKDIEIPERYRECGPECEHCHSKRHRKDTYIVYNEETGEFKQVGSSCLNDFTNGFSAEAAASYISLFDELIKGESPIGGYRVTPYYPVRDILLYAARFVQEIGYVSTSASEYGNRSTKDEVFLAYLYDNRRTRLGKEEIEHVEDYRLKFNPQYDSEENIKFVDDMLEYIRTTEATNDYLHNLQVIANSEYIEFRNMGYAVSMVTAYNKHLEIEDRKRKEAEAARVSEFVGTPGDRIELLHPTVEVVTSWENQFGYTIRYRITDFAGNVFMWDSSSGIDPDKEVASIKGTIKKHDEFRGCKQTWLTRCRVSYEEKKPEPASDNVDQTMDEFMEYVDGSGDDTCTSATAGDYSPSAPWNAPGMSVSDFI